VGRYEEILPAYTTYEDGTECSETSAYNIQTPGNYPEENIQRSKHGESLKSRISVNYLQENIIEFQAVKSALKLNLT